MAVVRQGPLVDADQAERIERLKITKAINDSAGTEQKSPVGNPPTGGSYLERAPSHGLFPRYQRLPYVTIMSIVYVSGRGVLRVFRYESPSRNPV